MVDESTVNQSTNQTKLKEDDYYWIAVIILVTIVLLVVIYVYFNPLVLHNVDARTSSASECRAYCTSEYISKERSIIRDTTSKHFFLNPENISFSYDWNPEDQACYCISKIQEGLGS